MGDGVEAEKGEATSLFRSEIKLTNLLKASIVLNIKKPSYFENGDDYLQCESCIRALNIKLALIRFLFYIICSYVSSY